MSLSSAEIHAEQQQRNLARFGTETFPGGRGDWPDFPEMIAPPADVVLDELHVMSVSELEAARPSSKLVDNPNVIYFSTAKDEPPIDDYPLWEG
jgi:hypothetical protein